MAIIARGEPGITETLREGWVTEPLGKVGKWFSGGTPRMSEAQYWYGDIPWVSPKDMKVARINDTVDHVTNLAIGNGTRVIPTGTVLMVVRGMILARAFPVAIAAKPLAFNQDVRALVTREGVESSYVLYWLQSKESQFLSICSESTHGTKRIPSESLFAQELALPPLPEQRAIATALSDVDALLAGLDALIAKKRDLKQAALQQLLTGKQRLPGFSGAWEVRRLGAVLSVRHGKSQHAVVASNGTYPILATGGEIGRTNTFLYDKPSVLIGRKGTIDRPQYQESPFWTIDTLFYTEVAATAYPKFMYYAFHTIDWSSYSEASGVPSLNASTIENIVFNCPEVNEQRAMAAVLSDMDAELAALAARRDKTSALKQGMMQELLTGRIRLL